MQHKGNYINIHVHNNGIELKATKEGKQRTKELIEADKLNNDAILVELLEDHLCNGWKWVQAEEIGALTDAPILSNDFEYTEDEYPNEYMYHSLYWFSDYQVTNEVLRLKKGKPVFFQKA